MPNFVYKNILKSEIERFKEEFCNTSKEVYYDESKNRIFHNSEYGKYRERIVKKFLKLTIPNRLDINSGFILTNKDEVSTECDIIIYDRNSSPLIQDSENQNFYPIETVVGIGEIKSTLSKSELKIALNKLAKNKSLRKSIDSDESYIKRENRGPFNLETQYYDNIFSFLICEKLSFSLEGFNIDELYDNNIKPYFRHNMVLSINDGLFLYQEVFRGKLKKGHYPTPESKSIIVDEYNKNHAIEIFSHYMFMGISSSTIFYPDFIKYI